MSKYILFSQRAQVRALSGVEARIHGAVCCHSERNWIKPRGCKMKSLQNGATGNAVQRIIVLVGKIIKKYWHKSILAYHIVRGGKFIPDIPKEAVWRIIT
ncbi:MAG: hypothetical protein ACYC9O_11640 [Candidatus Latescibacterota bacterium]